LRPYAIIYSMSNYLVADIGGTHMRAAVYSEGSRNPQIQKRIPTQEGGVPPLERLIALFEMLWKQAGSIQALAVAVPAPVTPDGVVIRAVNIPGWTQIPLREILHQRFGCPVFVDNDANLAALGEWRFGAAQGYHNVLYLTISTGIGGGVIIEDRLLRGERGLAAELGHTTVIPEGPLCNCGQRGHLEALASGTAIANYVRERLTCGEESSLRSLNEITASDVFRAAQQGDALAQKAFRRAGTYLGYALADFLHLFNPAIIVLGGGVSNSGALLLEPLRLALQEKVMSPDYLQDLCIVQAALGDNAGLMGALALAQSMGGV